MKTKDLRPDTPCLPSKLYGIDFSGGKKAGSKIWIASALIIGDVLKIEDCFQAKDLPNSSAERDCCLQALCHFISSHKACAFGLDFPFSLPKQVIQANSWEEFVLSFGNKYPDPEQFREICWVAAGNREERRVTDRVSHTPFSPYNRRLYRQTYYGIRDLLAPLVQEQLVCALPMQKMLPGKPWLYEICPASTLRRMGLPQSYKGYHKDGDRRAVRTHILEEIQKAGAVIIEPPALRSKILDDSNGDALDCIIAALATFRAVHNLTRSSVLRIASYALEGYVYI